MTSKQALKLINQYQKGNTYIVRTNDEYRKLAQAFKYLFEENAQAYINRIQI